MLIKKLLGALVLVTFVSQAGLLGASKEAKAYSVPIATYSGSALSSALDVKLDENKSLLKIARTSSPAGPAAIRAVGAVWLGAEFAKWVNSGVGGMGPGVIFSS